MLPSEYDLRVVEQRYYELRREAAAYHLAKAAQAITHAHIGIVARLRVLAGGHAPNTPSSRAA